MMRIALPLLLACAGCAGQERPYSPVHDVRFSAMGDAPFWMVTIGDDRIVLRVAPDRASGAAPADTIFARTLPRTVDGVTTWQSGNGGTAITIESRAGPCTDRHGQGYENAVRVTLDGRALNGCGGPLLGRSRD